MSNIGLTADKLRAKIEKLVHLHKVLADDNANLSNERQVLLKTIEEQKQVISKLEEQNRLARIARQMPGENGNLDLKLKINELVREIDKCIALLNR